MVTREYFHLSLHDNDGMAFLDEMGNKGWRVIHIVRQTSSQFTHYYLERVDMK